MPPEQNQAPSNQARVITSAPPAPPPAPTNPDSRPALKQIRTFQGDVASALGRQQESIYSIREKELAKTGGANVPTGDAGKSLLFLLGALVLIALSGAGGFFAYNEYTRRTAPPEAVAPPNRFFTPNTEVDLVARDASRDSLSTLIAENRSSVPEREVRHLILKESTTLPSGEVVQNLLPTTRFLTAFGLDAPDNFLRAVGEHFMLGTVGNSVFVVLGLNSFENAFAGALAWESGMADDLAPLFERAVEIREALTREEVFGDLIVRNKDMRALLLEGEPVLVYTFYNNEFLIISERVETVNTILDRLGRERLIR